MVAKRPAAATPKAQAAKKPACADAKKPAAAEAQDPKQHAEDDDDACSQVGSALSVRGSLQEKIDILKNHSELTDLQKLNMLKTKLTEGDWAALNGRVNRALEKDKDLATEIETAFDNGGRSERRNAICAWVLDPTKGKVYKELKHGMGQKQKWTKQEKWEGRSAYVPPKWTAAESDALVDSGRIVEREVVGCPGIFEYLGNGGMTVTKELEKNKALTGKQVDDIAPETDEAEYFQQLMGQINGLGSTDIMGGAVWGSSSKGRGRGSAAAIEDKSEGNAGQVEKTRKQQTEEVKIQKRAKFCGTLITNTIKTIDATLYNNGKNVASSKKAQLTKIKQALQELSQQDLTDTNVQTSVAVKVAT
ncbi:unnamed protein product [Prorocentrum cordatum]|uniref:Uncharacterized protein n=1 Tax=Prorocentrum cordatum TaxID=2364126 RepID=A0ABN9VXW1_9DINO|nr:unnamed protein product [Polarella glacialis]